MSTINRSYPSYPPFSYVANVIGKTTYGSQVEIDVHLEAAGVTAAQQFQKLFSTYENRVVELYKGIVNSKQIFTISLLRSHGDGGEHFGSGDTFMYIGVPPSPPAPPYDIRRWCALTLCEMVDVYSHMALTEWAAGTAHGEAFSRVIANAFVPGYMVGLQTVPIWLNSGRPNWVARMANSETDQMAIGCSVAFIHFMKDVKGIPFEKIVATRGRTLDLKFQKLTGEKYGFVQMMDILNKKFPPGKPVGNLLALDSPFI